MNIIKIVNLENKQIGFKEENLNISGLIRDYVNANRDDNTNKTSPSLNFTSLNPLDNNYSERY